MRILRDIHFFVFFYVQQQIHCFSFVKVFFRYLIKKKKKKVTRRWVGTQQVGWFIYSFIYFVICTTRSVIIRYYYTTNKVVKHYYYYYLLLLGCFDRDYCPLFYGVSKFFFFFFTFVHNNVKVCVSSVLLIANIWPWHTPDLNPLSIA